MSFACDGGALFAHFQRERRLGRDGSASLRFSPAAGGSLIYLDTGGFGIFCSMSLDGCGRFTWLMKRFSCGVS
jgi:hypothetical protein